FRRMWTLPLLAACLCVAINSDTWAEEKKAEKPAALDPKAVDAAVFAALRGVINTGADIYNIERDYAGCCRYYEGALTSYRPLLAHRPNLQKAIDDGIARGKTMPFPERAFALREVIDTIRKETNPEPEKPMTKTLWARLGGEPGVTKVVDEF